jgi:hypothetical protein
MKQASRPGSGVGADAVNLHWRWEVSNGKKKGTAMTTIPGRCGIITAGRGKIWLGGQSQVVDTEL